jgi:peptidoglycan DL-endopeptidase CwlO
MSAASSLSSAVTKSVWTRRAVGYPVRPAGNVSAVIVICGALVASLALPASAVNSTTMTKASAGVASVVAVGTPSAAPAPLLSRTFGTVAFAGVVKARPAVVPVARRGAVVVSRSTTRAPLTAVSSTPEAPVTVPAPRSGGLLGIAASLAGIYYVYGGTTTAGFDCSGYTQYVFNKVGISLPRTAEQQRQAATPVTNPQPGDLVFFGAPAHHVGIYAGNGKMWDSPETGSPVGLRTDRSERSGGATYGRV